MNHKHRKRIWPYLVAVSILFVFSVLAPREWCSLATTTVTEMEAQLEVHLAARAAAAERRESLAAEGTPRMVTGAAQPVAAEPAHPAVAAVIKQTVATEPELAVEPKLAAEPEPAVERLAGAEPVSATTATAAEAADSGSEPQAAPVGAPPHTPLDQYAVSEHVVEFAPPVTQQFVTPEEERALSAARVAERVRPVEPAATPRRSPPHDWSPTVAEVGGVLQRQATAAELGAHWPYAPTLAAAVSRLGEQPAYSRWAETVLDHLERLSTLRTLPGPEVRSVLDALQQLMAEAKSRAAAEKELGTRAQLLRTAHAMGRRLRLWEQVHAIAAQPQTIAHPSTPETLAETMETLDQKLRRIDDSGKWREYLLLSDAQRFFAASPPADTSACRALAKRILLRIEPVSFDAAQRRFLQQAEVVEYVNALKPLAVEPVDYFQLLQVVEDHETAPSAATALHIAAAQQMLRWSPGEAAIELGQRLDTHYRNANVRLTISKDILNRLLPEGTPVSENVSDVIQGAYTYGVSSGNTKLQAELLPSPNSWRLALLVDGEMSSETRSTSGPATFYNEGTAVFRAEKEVVVTAEGLQHEPAVADADSDMDLRGLATDYDALPILGNVAHNIARRQYQSRSGAARWETENKIAWRASRRLDREVEPKVEKAKQQFVQRLYEPLKKLALNPAIVDMQTTPDTLIARARLAGFHQLSAQTPRPKAPDDSLLSVQVHESALNNTIEQFGWAGRRASVTELHTQLAQLLQRAAAPLPEDFPDDVTLEFAKENPVRIALLEGRATITIGLKELVQGKNRWRDFVVRVHYRPAPEEPEADLVRDQYVELTGKRLGFRDQVALRGIFSRVFNRSQPINFITKTLHSDPRLRGLTVTQLVIDDGWIGVAVGAEPESAPPRERVTDRPAATRR